MLKRILQLVAVVVFLVQVPQVEAFGVFSSTGGNDIQPKVLQDGEVRCFDFYRFGSVQVSMEALPRGVTAGEKVTFTGIIRNDNPYPVVGVGVYVKIARIQGEEFRMRNGDLVVDEFAALNGLAIDTKEEQKISFSWQVPDSAVGGEYRMITYINSQQAFNLGGLSFTDDVTGNFEYFTVKGKDGESRPIELDRNAILLNGKPQTLVGSIAQFKKDEQVTVSVPLFIPEGTSKRTVSVTARTYSWDALKEGNLIQEETRDITVSSEEKKTFDFVLTTASGPVTYTLFDLKDGEHHSIVGVRFARNGLEQARLNFPTVSAFPFQPGEEYQLTSCLHSASLVDLSGRTLELRLVDGNGKELANREFVGTVTSDMMAYGFDFSSQKEVKKATLIATIKHDGVVEDTATMEYDCALLPSCAQQEESNMGLIKLIGLVALMMGIIFGVAVVYKKKRKSAEIVGGIALFILMSAGLFIDAPSVQAKSVGWSRLIGGNNGLYTDAWLGTTFYSEGEDHWKLHNGNFSISYNASSSVAENTTVNMGDTITFTAPMNNTDISWNGVGAFWDTPFGFYDSVPPTSRCDGVNWSGTSPASNDFWAYMVTQKPVVTVSGSGMSCTGLTCTATSAGPISATVSFAPTTSGFDFDVRDNWTFMTNGAPYPTCVSADELGGEDAGTFVIPQQNITFNFTGNNTPSMQITASSNNLSYGSISPSGVVNVPSGSSQSFTTSLVVPTRQLAWYHIDGNSFASPNNPYTFNNVVSNHSIQAVFWPYRNLGGISTPTNVTATPQACGGIVVNWNPVAAATAGYTVFEGIPTDPVMIPASGPYMVTTYTRTAGLTPGNTYCFSVEASNTYDSVPSMPVCAVAPAACAAPTINVSF